MSMTFAPSDAQANAIARIKDWFQNRTGEQQVFRVFGYAGTGKTTITKHAIAELGLTDTPIEAEIEGTGGVLYGAFTGKAAFVMRRKGTPARTIHSLAYAVTEATEEEIARATQALVDFEAKVAAFPPMSADALMASAAVEAQRMRIREMKRPRFSLNPASPIGTCKLLVLDEVSMVGPEMAADVLSFGKPILVLGDPGQLPPIKGEGAFTQVEPDVMLTDIHRQAGESPIIKLATMARQGQWIPFAAYDTCVWKMRKHEITNPAQLLRGGQVICGKNATRLDLNGAMRRAAGFDGELPTGEDEKIICLKNNNSLGLINGMFLQLRDIERVSAYSMLANITTEEGQPVKDPEAKKAKRLSIYTGHFEDHIRLDPDRNDRDWKIKKSLIEATYGWAITCHKSQGSQWENVIVWDDGLGRTQEDRARWLYTAITRAERGLLILE